MNHIPIHWLQALVQFHDSGDMQKAATALGITQPALSKQLKSLESRLPLPVLVPQGKRKVLTAYGEELYQQLHPRFHGLEADLRDLAQKHVQGAPPQIRIAARREVLDRLIHGLTATSCLLLKESSHEQILQQIRDRQTDLAISHKAPDTDHWIAKALFRESFQICVPKTLLARQPSDEPWTEALTRLPVVAYRDKDEILEQAALHQKVNPLRLKIVGITANYSSLRDWIWQGRGWGVLPSYLGDPENRCWRLQLPAKALPSREFFAIYRKDQAKARWLNEVLTEIKAAFKP